MGDGGGMSATAQNKLALIFVVSPYTDDKCWVVAALSVSWDGLGLVYMLLPQDPMVPTTLENIEESQGTTAIFIAYLS